MRRYFAIFLLMFLPLQLSWATVGAYCQHDTGQQNHQTGYHDHQQHKADAKDFKKAGGDADCCPCHIGCSVGLCSGATLPGIAEPHIQSPDAVVVKYPAGLPSKPERPKWAALA